MTGSYVLTRISEDRLAAVGLAELRPLVGSMRAKSILMDDISNAGYSPDLLKSGKLNFLPLDLSRPEVLVIQADHNGSGQIGDEKKGEPDERIEYSFHPKEQTVYRNKAPFLIQVKSFKWSLAEKTPQERSEVVVRWNWSVVPFVTQFTDIVVPLRNGIHP